MQKKNVILWTAGIILVVLLLSARRKKLSGPDVIQPGDKGTEVYGLQAAINSMTGLQFKNMGVYDNETLSAVKYYLRDSYALQNYEKGHVDRKFASDLYLIQSKLIK